MYLDNKYTTWYNNIIHLAQNREKPSCYVERHHVLPHALGGDNTIDNLVYLTAREHFICHQLLPNMVSGKEKKKMIYALWLMSNRSSDNQTRYVPSSKIYAHIREEFSTMMSKKMAGANNPMFGRVPSVQEMQNRLDGAKRRLPPTRETVKKRALSNTGKKRSDESRQKMRDAWTKKKKISCAYCGIMCPPHLHNRWHGDNCKHKV
jgi:hypothetical protein